MFWEDRIALLSVITWHLSLHSNVLTYTRDNISSTAKPINQNTTQPAYYITIQPTCVIQFNGMLEDNLTVTWKLPDDVTFNQSSLRPIVTWISDYSFGYCSITTLTSCICDFGEDSVMDSNSIFSLNVTIVKKGRNIRPVFHAIWRIDSENCSKPSPVQNVTLTSINSTCIGVGWTPMVTCSDLLYNFDIYRISYRQKDGNKHWIRVVCGSVCTNCTNPYSICGLSPYTSYDVIVQNKRLNSQDEPSGHWSDYTVVMVTTDEDVPSGAPQMIPGGYIVTTDSCKQENRRGITIYWKEVKKQLCNGRITIYEILAMNLLQKKTETFISHSTMRQFNLTLRCDVSYDIILRAGTNVGLSNKHSTLLIEKVASKEQNGRHHDVDIIPEIDINQTAINITLTDDRQISNYSYIVWCKATTKYVCESPLDWKKIPKMNPFVTINRTNVSFPLHEIKVGVASSENGIMWSQCLYKETKDIPRPGNLRVIPSLVEKTGVEIVWDNLPCSRGHIYPYVVCTYIYLCPTSRIDSPTCSGSTVVYSVDGRYRSFILDHLSEDTIYKIYAVTVGLRGLRSPKSVEIYARPHSNKHFLGSPVFIVLVVMSVLTVLLALVFFTRRLLRRCVGYYKRLKNVDVPEIILLADIPEG